MVPRALTLAPGDRRSWNGSCVAQRSAVTSSIENPIPTQTFLLPGQGFCIGLPWERAELPKHGLPALAPKPIVVGNVLDQKAELEGDPCAGWEIGRCEVIRGLTPASARRLLALRHDLVEGSDVVDLRQLDVDDGEGPTIEAYAADAMRLRHPSLAHVHDCEVSDEGTFWVSERVSSATLAEIAAACRVQGKAVPIGLALPAVHEAALALHEVHQRATFVGELFETRRRREKALTAHLAPRRRRTATVDQVVVSAPLKSVAKLEPLDPMPVRAMPLPVRAPAASPSSRRPRRRSFVGRRTMRRFRRGSAAAAGDSSGASSREAVVGRSERVRACVKLGPLTEPNDPIAQVAHRELIGDRAARDEEGRGPLGPGREHTRAGIVLGPEVGRTVRKEEDRVGLAYRSSQPETVNPTVVNESGPAIRFDRQECPLVTRGTPEPIGCLTKPAVMKATRPCANERNPAV